MLDFLRILVDILAYFSLGLLLSVFIFVRFYGGVVHLEYYEDDEEGTEEDDKKSQEE